MVASDNSHTNATRIGWPVWEDDLRFAPGLPPGWLQDAILNPHPKTLNQDANLIWMLILDHGTIRAVTPNP